jgi:hypothetical protein
MRLSVDRGGGSFARPITGVLGCESLSLCAFAVMVHPIPILGIDNENGGRKTSVLLDCCIRALCSNRA